MTSEEFVAVCRVNGLALSASQIHLFNHFVANLTEWNAKLNLISRKDMEHAWEKHILHSVALLWNADIPPGARIADIGTGGGFPGIPMKICRPDLQLVLFDSIQKKIKAVDAMIVSLQGVNTTMSGISAICGRAEELAPLPRFKGAFDIAVARSVARLGELALWSHPLLTNHGRLIALKGGVLDAEIGEALAHPLMNSHPFSIAHHPLRAKGVPEFERDEKQIVEIQW